MPSAHDLMVRGLLEDYYRAPWDWEAVTLTGSRLVGFARNKTSGVIIAVPTDSEWEKIMGTNTIDGIGGIGGLLSPLLPHRGAGPVAYRSGVKLGETYRDDLTGYEGVAIGIYFYFSGCERVELEFFDKKRRDLKSAVFDATRLIDVGTGSKVESSKEPGGPDKGGTARSVPKR